MIEALTIIQLCIQGLYLCERSVTTPMKYDRIDSNASCYRDGIFYPRCNDLNNPEVLYYHNLFK